MRKNMNKQETKNILIVHHKSDNDGLLSASLISYYLSSKGISVDTWGVEYDELNRLWNSGEDDMSNRFLGYDGVYMTDISFNSTKAMLWMRDNISNLFWFDHHKPIIDASREQFDNIPGIRNTQQSAIMCVYQYFYDSELSNVPQIIQELSDYDSWQWVKKDYYTEKYITSINTGFTELSELSLDFWLHNIERILSNNRGLHDEALHVGQIVERYRVRHYKRLLNQSDREWLVDGRKAIVLFGENVGSTAYRSVRNTGIEIGVSIMRMRDGRWKISICDINDSDVFDCGSYLREHYEGGGHRGAAGCIVSEETFINILKNRQL